MRILITGGAGFIGSNLAHHLCNRHDVIVYDKLTYAGNITNLVDIKNKIDFIKGDVCNKEALMKAMRDCDWVVHLGAETHVDKSITSSQRFIKTNVLGTNTVLECARKNDISKMIHISTDEVYGSTKSGFFTEQDAMFPSSPYSASKAGGDVLAQSYHTTYDLPVIITRPANNFGKYQYPEKLIPFFVTRLIRGKSLPIYGNGQQIRSWLHVDDTCRGLELLLTNGINGEIYNMGSNHEETNLSLTQKIIDIVNLPHTIKHVNDRVGHDFRYGIDSSKLHALGWKQQTDFDEALTKTIHWYMNNKPWWRNLV